jgi:uncharacterized protein (DUF1810 family)
MPFMNDPHGLKRFVDAQNPVYEQVLVELHNGQKEGHWMWFIFPQLRGLGHSHMAATFGIASRQEAESIFGTRCSWAATEGVHSSCMLANAAGRRLRQTDLLVLLKKCNARQ